MFRAKSGTFTHVCIMNIFGCIRKCPGWGALMLTYAAAKQQKFLFRDVRRYLSAIFIFMLMLLVWGEASVLLAHSAGWSHPLTANGLHPTKSRLTSSYPLAATGIQCVTFADKLRPRRERDNETFWRDRDSINVNSLHSALFRLAFFFLEYWQSFTTIYNLFPI